MLAIMYAIKLQDNVKIITIYYKSSIAPTRNISKPLKRLLLSVKS